LTPGSDPDRIPGLQLHAAQTSAGEAAQEVGPEDLGFRWPDRHAQHLAPAIAVDTDRDGDSDRDNAPGTAYLEVGGVDPDVGPVAFERAVEERLHTFVDLLAHPADLALRDATHPHRPDEIID